jgi:hypothetical protein
MIADQDEWMEKRDSVVQLGLRIMPVKREILRYA